MASLDEVFELLSRERRRYVLYYLDQADGPVSVDELAAKLREWEGDGPTTPSAGDDYEDMAITLEHEHLPKLANAEFLEYAREDETLRITDMETELNVVLTVAKALELPAKTEEVVHIDDLF